MPSKIYTKKGDRGQTSLIGGTKVSKSDLHIEAYGTVDELNSYIGLCQDFALNDKIKLALKGVQDSLFTIGAMLATDSSKDSNLPYTDINESDIKYLETAIDEIDSILPQLKSFILPGGNIAVSHLHIARCICRRAERCCVRLLEDTQAYEIVIQYLNRLSDYLFVLARFTAHLLNMEDIVWKPRT
jgi:cob(I)alamin adenosyltransferase